MKITYDDARQRMTTIRANFRREVDEARTNNNYSDAGRRLAMAKAYREHKKKAAALREQLTSGSKERRRELERRIFGIPNGGDASAYRDAVDRAGELTNVEQADKMLARAQRTGDDLLARAVADRARTRGWNTVVRTYAADTNLTAALDELSDLPGEKGLGVLFSILPPNEISNLTNDARLDEFITRAENPEAPTANGRAYDQTGSSALTYTRTF